MRKLTAPTKLMLVIMWTLFVVSLWIFLKEVINSNVPSFILWLLIIFLFVSTFFLSIYWPMKIFWYFVDYSKYAFRFHMGLFKTEKDFRIGAVSGLFVGFILLMVYAAMDFTSILLVYIHDVIKMDDVHYYLFLYASKYGVGLGVFLWILKRFGEILPEKVGRGG